jgi:hypothetical protein
MQKAIALILLMASWASADYYKNTASKITFYAWNTSANAPKTGDAANITARVRIDGGTLTQLTDTSATEIDATNAPGAYEFDATAGEMNGDILLFTAKSTTASVYLAPRTVAPRATNIKTVFVDDFATNYNTTLDKWNTNATYLAGNSLPTSVANVFSDASTTQDVWEYNISAFAGAGYAGTYVKTLYDKRPATGSMLDDSVWTGTKAGYLDAAISSRSTLTASDNIGINWADITNPTTAQSLSGTTIGTVTTLTGHTPQTGDAYARLGAPAGASVSADVAAVKSETVSILADTGTDGVIVAASSKTGYSVSEFSVSALADLFNTNSGTTYAAAVAGSVVKEMADNAGGATLTNNSIADAVWGGDRTTRQLTALDEDSTAIDLNGSLVGGLTTWEKTGYSLSASGVDDIWDEALAAHTTSDTPGKVLNILTQDAVTLSSDVTLNSVFGMLLDNGSSWTFDRTTDSLEAIRDNMAGADAGAIADAVWDEAMSGHTGDGTFGGDFLDADIWTPARAAYLDTLNGNVAQTGDTFARLGAPAGASVSVDMAAVKADTAATLVDTGSSGVVVASGSKAGYSLAADQSSVTIGTTTNITNGVTVTTNNDKTGYTINDLTQNALAKFFNRDSGTTYAASVPGSVVKEITDNAGGSLLTNDSIADAIWEEMKAAHTTPGTFGAGITADIEPADIWTYGTRTLTAGTKDSQIDAIKAKTDNLPASPAAVGSQMTLADDAITASKFDGTTAFPQTGDAYAVVTSATYGLSVLKTLLEALPLLSEFFTVNSGQTIDTAINGSVVKEMASQMLGNAIYVAWTYTLTSGVTGLPVPDADVWATTDSAGKNIVSRSRTDAFGVARLYLSPGTYYVWRARSGYSFSPNPQTNVVP